MADSWKTKWGARRVRHDPPTLAEALAAAQGFTDDHGQQARFAADLMGVSVADAERERSRLARTERTAAATILAPAREKGRSRTVVIERKASRRSQPAPVGAKGHARPF